jgi:Relaxase/Mobilisation nuclease domain
MIKPIFLNMISVIYKNPKFLDTLEYVLGKEDAEIVNTNMPGATPKEFNEKFLQTKYNNSSVKLPCAHLIISIRKDEHLSNSQCSYVVQEYLKDMGFLPKNELSAQVSQYVAVKHHDRDHEHLHIVASRIQLDGKLVRDSYERFNSQVSTRRIAAELNLETTPITNNAVATRLSQEYGIATSVSPNRSPSIRSVNSKHQTPSSKGIIKSAIGEAIKDCPSVSDYIQRLEENNIKILPKIQGEELLGFTYVHNHVKIAGYQVYKPYSWNKLQSEYGVNYQPERDRINLHQAKFKTLDFIINGNKGSGDSSSDNSQSSSNSPELSQQSDISVENTPDLQRLNFQEGKPKKQRKVNPDSPSLNKPDKSEISTSTPANTNEPEVNKVENVSIPVETQVEFTELNNLELIIAETEKKTKKKSDNITEKQAQEDIQPTISQNISPEYEQQIIEKTQPREIEKAEPQQLDESVQHLPKIIVNYMLANDNPIINGKELSATLDGHNLTVRRHGEDKPIMEVVLDKRSWYQISETSLTSNEIKQIESLEEFTKQILQSQPQANKKDIFR